MQGVAFIDSVLIAQAGAPPEGALTEEVHPETEINPEEGVFPPFDASTFASQLLWLAITFGALYLLMARVVLPRIGGILEDRRDRIASDLDHAERLKQQSDQALASYERALADARANAFKIAEDSRERAKAEADARQQVIEADLSRRIEAAENRIGEIAVEAAQALVERLLGKAPSRTETAAAVAAAHAASMRQREAVNV